MKSKGSPAAEDWGAHRNPRIYWSLPPTSFVHSPDTAGTQKTPSLIFTFKCHSHTRSGLSLQSCLSFHCFCMDVIGHRVGFAGLAANTARATRSGTGAQVICPGHGASRDMHLHS